MGLEPVDMRREKAVQPANTLEIGGGLGSKSVLGAFFWSLSMFSNSTSAMARLIGCKVRHAESDTRLQLGDGPLRLRPAASLPSLASDLPFLWLQEEELPQLFETFVKTPEFGVFTAAVHAGINPGAVILRGANQANVLTHQIARGAGGSLIRMTPESAAPVATTASR